MKTTHIGNRHEERPRINDNTRWIILDLGIVSPIIGGLGVILALLLWPINVAWVVYPILTTLLVICVSFLFLGSRGS